MWRGRARGGVRGGARGVKNFWHEKKKKHKKKKVHIQPGCLCLFEFHVCIHTEIQFNIFAIPGSKHEFHIKWPNTAALV